MFLFRSTLPRLRAFLLLTIGLASFSSSALAQDSDLAPLPPAPAASLDAPSLLFYVPPASNVSPNPALPEAPVAKISNDRILWTIPNFLTVEDADKLPPLTPGEKFKVVARGVFDPFEFILIGFVAGLGQASNSNPSYGQGWEGYAKRYGTAYADNAIENFMASAVFPVILHQDPRFYQLGKGGFWRRTEHAMMRVVITRSDSGQRQINYSELVGGLSAAAISTYTYHPESDRGFGKVVSVWASQVGWDSVTYMLKEFWPDLRKRSKKDKNSTAAPAAAPSAPPASH